jgi:DinB superfamily
VNDLSTADIARLLRASEAEITAEVAALPDELLSWHPEHGEWCVNECLGHVIEAERRGFAGRIRFLLQHSDNPALTSWAQVDVARERNDCEADTRILLKEFSDERAASVVLLTSLQPEDLSRGGEHPQVGHLTIGEIVSEWVHHDRNHFKQMLTNVQSYAWRQMGAAQRFSLPH